MYVLVAIQKFIENIFKSLMTIIKVVILSRFRGWIKMDFKGEQCVVLGNGPSLTKTITDNPEFLKGKKLISVNHFPRFDLYEELKPEIWVTVARELWLNNVDQKHKDESRMIFEAIASKTTWKIALYFPAEAKKYKAWQEIVAPNPNIRIHYFNPTPVEGFRWFRNLLFKLNMGMARPHNVVIPSLMIGLNLGFKDIYLFGVDHTWMQELSVDDNNRVLVNMKHFYDEKQSKGEPVQKLGRGERKLHEVLNKFLRTFEGYFPIQEYAETQNAKIYNCTPGSFIDAFERLKLENKGNATE